ncbi:hypothetical protein J6590_045227 [Homalodisca vitripennis]|nr:hypothetical protein J6590_045227 [Homalodisca vitripennis]
MISLSCLLQRLVSDAISALTPGNWSQVRLKRQSVTKKFKTKRFDIRDTFTHDSRFQESSLRQRQIPDLRSKEDELELNLTFK